MPSREGRTRKNTAFLEGETQNRDPGVRQSVASLGLGCGTLGSGRAPVLLSAPVLSSVKGLSALELKQRHLHLGGFQTAWVGVTNSGTGFRGSVA